MRLSIILVAFGGELTGVLDAIAGQRRPDDEVVVVDNLSAAGGTDGVRGHPAVDVLIEPATNLHYARGANLGAAHSHGDAIVVLNPDAVPEDGWLDALRAPPAAWDAWSAVLALPGGDRINNAGGVVHFLGLAWSGRFEEPVAALPAEPYPAGFLTGGCLAVRRGTWEALGGYAGDYVAYHEDTELSLRLRLAGHAFGFLPAARARHEYVFHKGPAKWRFLEANRWRTILRTYPAHLLLALVPALLAAEAAILLAAWRGGWLRSKLAAYGDVAAALPALARQRREVQEQARISPRAFADGLVWRMDSPFLGPAAASPPAAALLRAYWRIVLAVLPR